MNARRACGWSASTALALCLALTGCAGSPTGAKDHDSTPGSLPTSSWSPGDTSAAALLVGVLHADRHSECVWIEPAEGGYQHPIVWPAGYSVRFGPKAEIFGPNGQAVAREGQTIKVGGGTFPIPDGTSRCMLGKSTAFWVQSSVEVVGPDWRPPGS